MGASCCLAALLLFSVLCVADMGFASGAGMLVRWGSFDDIINNGEIALVELYSGDAPAQSPAYPRRKWGSYAPTPSPLKWKPLKPKPKPKPRGHNHEGPKKGAPPPYWSNGAGAPASYTPIWEQPTASPPAHSPSSANVPSGWWGEEPTASPPTYTPTSATHYYSPLPSAHTPEPSSYSPSYTPEPSSYSPSYIPEPSSYSPSYTPEPSSSSPIQAPSPSYFYAPIEGPIASPDLAPSPSPAEPSSSPELAPSPSPVEGGPPLESPAPTPTTALEVDAGAPGPSAQSSTGARTRDTAAPFVVGWVALLLASSVLSL